VEFSGGLLYFFVFPIPFPTLGSFPCPLFALSNFFGLPLWLNWACGRRRSRFYWCFLVHQPFGRSVAGPGNESWLQGTCNRVRVVDPFCRAPDYSASVGCVTHGGSLIRLSPFLSCFSFSPGLFLCSPSSCSGFGMVCFFP